MLPIKDDLKKVRLSIVLINICFDLAKSDPIPIPFKNLLQRRKRDRKEKDVGS